MKRHHIKYSFIIFLLFSFISVNAQTVRILAIGNSFSVDAVENYLYDIGKADNVELIIGNMYISGCSLATHWINAKGNLPAYSYRKIVNGQLTTTAKQNLLTAIKDEDWDVITFQQASPNSGRIETFFPDLTNLHHYVRSESTNPQVKFAMHQTWAYAANKNSSAFATYYNNNQLEMFWAIVAAVNGAAVQTGIDIVIPVGTAIQNGRTSYIGDNFNRDGSHLSFGLGRYVAACTWYEKLLGKTVIGNTFIPAGVTKAQAIVAQNAAHYAVLAPDSITSLINFEENPIVGLVKQVNVNFGLNPAPTPWNSLTDVRLNSSISELLDIDGDNTGVSITVNDAFHRASSGGPKATTTIFNMPSESSSEYFYGNAVVFNEVTEPTGGFLLAGLDATKQYDFNFFSSRSNTTDNRETTFTLTGSTTKTGAVNSSNNTTNILTIPQLTPHSNGTISISVSPGVNNNNGNKFFYINSLIIQPSNLLSVKNLNEYHLRLYPNPAKNQVSIESAQAGLGNIKIVDLQGRIVFSRNEHFIGTETIDLNLAKGVYFVQLAENLPFEIQKLIIK